MFRLLLLPLGLLLLANLSSAEVNTTLPAAVTSEREMVVTANPLATAAGTKIVQFGGTAVDAMIAVQAVLGLVELTLGLALDGAPDVVAAAAHTLRGYLELDRGEPRTLEEVGEHFNLTRERIRQIEARAMSKLRQPSSATSGCGGLASSKRRPCLSSQ